MTDLEMKAAVIAQGYLLELLVLNLVHNQKEPLATLEHIRFQLRTQLADDFQKGFQASPRTQAEMDAWRVAVDKALAIALDRVANQLVAPSPPKHQA